MFAGRGSRRGGEGGRWRVNVREGKSCRVELGGMVWAV